MKPAGCIPAAIPVCRMHESGRCRTGAPWPRPLACHRAQQDAGDVCFRSSRGTGLAAIAPALMSVPQQDSRLSRQSSITGLPGGDRGNALHMAIRDQFIEIPGGNRELRPTYLFMMKCLLYSRMETGLVSNKDFYDEDVNVYIAHLLNAFTHPEFVERSRPFLSKYDTEVFQRLGDSRDARLKYTLYKTNADFLLISLGIFDNPTALFDPPGGKGTQAEWMRPSEEAYVGRGRTYYRFAYTYSQRIRGRNTAITDVLEKLSVGFDKYLRILAHMRGEYLNLLRSLSRGEIYHLERVVNESQKEQDVKLKQDQLLDLYLEWKQTRDSNLREQMEALQEEIRRVLPEFHFQLPES